LSFISGIGKAAPVPAVTVFDGIVVTLLLGITWKQACDEVLILMSDD
jgi:hypothetical protein